MGYLGCSVLKVYLTGAVNKKGGLQVLDLKVMLRGYLCISGLYKLHKYFGTIPRIA